MFRTIYVPLENAVNVPDSYELSVGTSFGYKVRLMIGDNRRTGRLLPGTLYIASCTSRPEKFTAMQAGRGEGVCSYLCPAWAWLRGVHTV
jgi:hypothetical protein